MVLLFDEKVGELQQENHGGMSFSYDQAWLSNPKAVALSQSLPLRQEPFGNLAANPFFSGLLPDGQLRIRVARILQVSWRNDFSLLDRLGGECAGAVSLVKDLADAHPPFPPSIPQWLDNVGLVGLLDILPKRPMLADESGPRLSLAGAQDKLPVLAQELDGQVKVALPAHGSPSSHILKTEMADFPGGNHNEAFCLALANACGLRAAKASVHQVPSFGRFFLLVERYDRLRGSDGQLRRIHQEDFCQAFGIDPECKYQGDGGPDLPACFGLLRSSTRPSATEVIRFLDGVVFNALVGNNDAHAKNFSLLHDKRFPSLAPLYDILCTAAYPGLSDKMAMTIGSKYRFGDLFPRHWDALALNSGLSPAQVKKRLLQMAVLLPGQARELMNGFNSSGLGHEILGKIVAIIEDRCGTVIQKFK
jgi:serine/threonine-protein kinase HipA